MATGDALGRIVDGLGEMRWLGPLSHRTQGHSIKGLAVDVSKQPVAVDRVQLGVRMERQMVKVLKGLAEFRGVSLRQLLENIVLHSFAPVPGQEGEMSYSPHGKKALQAISDFKRIYGMDFDTYALRASYHLEETPEGAGSRSAEED